MRFHLSLCFLVACQKDSGFTSFNAEPEAEITSHADDAELYEGDVETFRGAVTDPDHGAEDLVAIWYMGVDEVCAAEAPDANGTTSCDVLIDAEEETITLEVRDPKNAGGSDVIEIRVIATESPEAAVLTPEADGVYYSDELIEFSGLVSDGEDNAEALTAWWESSLDGVLDVEATPNADGEVLDAG